MRKSRYGVIAVLFLSLFFVVRLSLAYPPDLTGTSWVLSSIAGRTLQAGVTATAHFEEGRIQGTDGCNRYTMPYRASGLKLKIGPRGASTMMACLPEVTQQAEAFTANLGKAKSYRISEGQLELLARNGAVLLSFVPQNQSLPGPAWQATGINNGRGGVASLVMGSSVMMNFMADGKVNGFAGCNQYSASYSVEGAKLHFTPAASGRKMCFEEGVMEQEHNFFKAMASVATMRMEGDRLEMRDADNALAIELTRTK